MHPWLSAGCDRATGLVLRHLPLVAAGAAHAMLLIVQIFGERVSAALE